MAALEHSGLVPHWVIDAFAETARRLCATEDIVDTLGRITAAAVELVPACDLATITVLERAEHRTEGATDALGSELDAAQYLAGEGPCLSAIETGEIIRTPDVSADGRWPIFARAVADHSVRSVVVIPLFVHEDGRLQVLGSLNLYGYRVDAFGDDDVAVAVLLGAHGGVVLHAAHQVRNLRHALESRDAIGQAKGILMERERLTADQAFDRLRAVSQRMNIKLRALAERLVLTGELDRDGDESDAPS